MKTSKCVTIESVREMTDVPFLPTKYDSAFVGVFSRFSENDTAAYNIVEMAKIERKKLCGEDEEAHLQMSHYRFYYSTRTIKGIDDVRVIFPMTMEDIGDAFPAILKPDGYEDTCLGVTLGANPVAVFSDNEIIGMIFEDMLENDDHSLYESEDEMYTSAVEFFNFNIIGAWVGEKTPGFIHAFE